MAGGKGNNLSHVATTDFFLTCKMEHLLLVLCPPYHCFPLEFCSSVSVALEHMSSKACISLLSRDNAVLLASIKTRIHSNVF